MSDEGWRPEDLEPETPTEHASLQAAERQARGWCRRRKVGEGRRRVEEAREVSGLVWAMRRGAGTPATTTHCKVTATSPSASPRRGRGGGR